MTEETQVQEQEAPKDLLTAVAERLEGVEGAPTKDQIMEWKKKYGGNINVFPFSDEEFYIFRPLSRKEYRNIQSLPDTIRNANKDATPAEVEEKYQDEICLTAILYPSKEELKTKLEFIGGLATLLSDQICYASCLVSPDTAIASIRKL